MNKEITPTCQRKLDRIWMHLLKLEKMAGSPLRRTTRFKDDDCPIENFAPVWSRGYKFSCCVSSGVVYYNVTAYKIYTLDDSEWWRRLEATEQAAVTKWLRAKIKEHYQRR